jgi:hypothetical protein
MYCRECLYDLQGIAERRCPECGRAFDPANRRTFSRSRLGKPVDRFGRTLRILLFVDLVICCVLVCAVVSYLFVTLVLNG